MPVHCHTIFCGLMHFMGAYLDLYELIVQTEDGCMQCAITIWLGIGDKIFDASIFGLPESMDVPKGNVTICWRLYQDAECDQIMNLIDISGSFQCLKIIHIT